MVSIVNQKCEYQLVNGATDNVGDSIIAGVPINEESSSDTKPTGGMGRRNPVCPVRGIIPGDIKNRKTVIRIPFLT
jgi:hypothetical protein|tara:strand:+ start:16593 stop:16820 length:228 start_codon:yes stop_codon:yes gene_type:complete